MREKNKNRLHHKVNKIKNTFHVKTKNYNNNVSMRARLQFEEYLFIYELQLDHKRKVQRLYLPSDEWTCFQHFPTQKGTF